MRILFFVCTYRTTNHYKYNGCLEFQLRCLEFQAPIMLCATGKEEHVCGSATMYLDGL